MATTLGIDISRWQGEIYWDLLQPNINFVFHRATVGNYYTDSKFFLNYDKSRQYDKFPVGAYHVITPEYSAISQIGRFQSVIGNRKLDLPPVLDCELVRGQTITTITRVIKECANLIESFFGVKPIIYTNYGFWNSWTYDFLGSEAMNWDQYDLFVANYGASTPLLPRSWDSWVFWQFSDTGTLPGIDENVDLDYFNGTIEELLIYSNINVEEPPDQDPDLYPTAVGEITAGALNVRTGPSTSYPKISLVYSGDKVLINNIEGKEVWVEIGKDKWIAMYYNGNQYVKLLK